jgi:chromosomal replication initiation ATPase DnaA
VTHDQTDRREVFLFVASEQGLDAAIETMFAIGVDWARTHLGFLHRSRGQIHRAEVSVIAAELGVTADDLWRDSRTIPELVQSRQLAMWLLRRRHNISYPAIGRALHRDHSTVIHGVRKVEKTPDLLARGNRILAARAA